MDLDTMATSIDEKLVSMFKILSDHKFTVIGVTTNDIKCILCGNIIVNAKQALCGCNFCNKCIINNGSNVCPGNTEKCKLENISQAVINHKLNEDISKLCVKCPEEKCSFECHLIDMDEHLHKCDKKTEKCPFFGYGCTQKIESKKMNSHMLREAQDHNNMLIDLLGNLKNEVIDLREKEKKNHFEIEKLKEKGRAQDEKLKSMYENLQAMRRERDEIRQRIQTSNQNVWYKSI